MKVLSQFHMVDMIIVLVVLICVILAILFIRREKKKGVTCIGCSSAGTCPYSGSKRGCPGCKGGSTDSKE